MATSSSTRGSEAACEDALRRLPAEKHAAWMGFLQAHSVLTKALDADLIATFGLQLSAIEVLVEVAQAEGGPMRMAVLAERTLLSQSRISRLVTDLERRGLVRREACTTDTRVVYVTMTDEGRELVGRIQEFYFDAIERRFFDALTAGEVKLIADLWPRVIAAARGPATRPA